MKIGIVLSNPPGYSETFFTSKIKGLQSNGIEVILFVQNNNTNFKLCPVYQAPKAYPNYPIIQTLLTIKVLFTLIPFLKTVLKFIKLERKENTSLLQIVKKIYLNSHILRHKVDWLHFGFATQALGSELVAKVIGAKMAVSFRGFDINVYPLKHQNCYSVVWKNVEKVHSISNYLLQKAYGLGLSKEEPFKIITPAVDLQKSLLSQNNVVTERSRSDKKFLKIVTIARLNWIKGIDLAINTMKILKEENINFEYHIIGGGSIKDTERYQFQAHQMGLENNVIFHGKLSHSYSLKLLNDADIYIQPSYNEGFCNAVLEAQALGKLCIVSNVGGLPENIEHKKTGWLVPKYNPKALADKIIEVQHLPEAEKQQISKNAQERVKKHFTVEQQQKKFLDFYNN